MYEEAPQLYSQMLQNGLDKQFQLATQAQPVSQFLAGLRQAQMQKMQQEQIDRQNALAEETMRHNRDTEDIAQQNQNRYLADQDRKTKYGLLTDAIRFQKELGNSGTGADFGSVDAINAGLKEHGVPFTVKRPEPLKTIGGTPDTLTEGDQVAPPATFSGLIGKPATEGPAGLPSLPSTNPFSSLGVDVPDTITPGEPGQTIWNNKQGQAQVKDMAVNALKDKKIMLDQEISKWKESVAKGNLTSVDSLRKATIERDKTLNDLNRAMNEAKITHLDYQDTALLDENARKEKVLPSVIAKNEAVAGMEDRKFLPGQPRYMTQGEQKALATLKATPGANVKQFIADLKNKGVIVVAE